MAMNKQGIWISLAVCFPAGRCLARDAAYKPKDVSIGDEHMLVSNEEVLMSSYKFVATR
jgi:hypothetical protein